MTAYFTIGGHSFSTYWTVFCVGVIGMLIMNCIRGRRYGWKAYKSLLFTIGVIFVSFLGAKLLYYIENPAVLMQNGIRVSGVSFFGAVFLVPVVMYGVCKVTKHSYDTVMDFLSPSLMLMLALLRIGCYISGCCGGCSLVFAGVYMERFPTQITECVCDLLILAGLLFYERFWDNEGRLYFFIMVYYGVIRFLIEFVRDTPKDWLYLSHGQWFSVISICIGGYVLHRLGRRDRKRQHKRSRR